MLHGGGQLGQRAQRLVDIVNVVRVAARAARGDHARARRLQEALAPLASFVTAGHGVAALKLAMDLVGRRGGSVRAPLLPAPDALRDEIRPLLEAAEAAV